MLACIGLAGAIVCVIERANMIVSRMMEEECLNQLSALVIDELHMVGDDDR
jgi:DNA polymerase theta